MKKEGILSRRPAGRSEILGRLRAKAARGEPIIGGGAGTGLSARCEEAGGIDLIVIYNSGRYRMAGRGSLAGLLPYGNANLIVKEMAGEVLTAVKSTPVIAGVCGTDPFLLPEHFLNELIELGFAGIQNFPTVGLFDGTFRRNLEDTGMGYQSEVELIALAHNMDLLTTPYVFNREEARLMTEAGADIVVAHMGLTTGGDIGARKSKTLEHCATEVQSILDTCKSIRPDVLVLCHGGPISSPEDGQYIFDHCTGLDGFYGASSMERLPTETAITSEVVKFTQLNLRKTPATGPASGGISQGVGKAMCLLCLIASMLSLLPLIVQAGSSDQYAVQESLVVKEVAGFEEGVDTTWNPWAGQHAAHFWTTAGAFYSYTPGTTVPVMATTTDPTDNINYWDVFGNSNGVPGYTGYGDLDYQLYIPTSGKIYASEPWTSNYQNWNGYASLQLKWYGWNTDPTKNVMLQVFAWTQANGGQWLELFPWTSRAPNTIYTDNFSLAGFTSTQLSQISLIKFRVANTSIAPGDAAHCGRQRTHLYGLKLTTSNVATASVTIGSQTITSHFLGTVFDKRYGSYSASGFYDTGMNSPGKFKIWYGSGIPERDSGDNVYYVETDTLDPSALKNGDLKSVRCAVTPTNLWVNDNGVPWCWGDPSVIRMMSSWDPPACTYFMFVSALAVGTTWNQVYRLVSSDGINWTINPTTPVVAAVNGGVAGYGSGAPSVVVAQGYYWLYYYSQFESAGPGVYVRKCTDGVSWGLPIKTSSNVTSALDVKYIATLNEFVAVSDVGIQGAGVYTLTSSDGINWIGGPPYLSQDVSAYVCHNPGFIGDDQGNGWPDMFVTYGISQESICATEYYTRLLGYSAWHIE